MGVLLSLPGPGTSQERRSVHGRGWGHLPVAGAREAAALPGEYLGTAVPPRLPLFPPAPASTSSCRVGDLQQRLLLHFSSPSTALGVLLVPGAFSRSWGAQTARTLPSRGRKGQGNPASGQARVCRTLSRPRNNVFCSTGLEECPAPSCPKGPSPLWVSIK